MVSVPKYHLKTLVLGGGESYVNDIKRLALIFDELIIPPATLPVIKDSRVSRKEGKHLFVDNLNIDDIHDMHVPPIQATSDTKEKDVLLNCCLSNNG